ncbi:uncharacterized protein PFL1_05187 [Pseudozyma flocculosa PF-1]|uniref:PSP1 C-terminal domain-containing protein n=2 Tax=Pseudozyma flocculosa TaxID=84751 RepID=A0A5C3F7C7_9BASI|nr:uncharacterized protein PFL1_05187 [Pseudozyma flocculosa PF-1]EPQ27264.1 hypothetical protein PFL1_05187 [Pseudozyma flocculosa PF-1]SPO39635.1 uncharacterized protein PSFLO_05116 [Pseudozyma flocculosa]
MSAPSSDRRSKQSSPAQPPVGLAAAGRPAPGPSATETSQADATERPGGGKNGESGTDELRVESYRRSDSPREVNAATTASAGLAVGSNGRPRLTIDRRSLSVNTGALGRSPAPPLSPSAAQWQSLERPQIASSGVVSSSVTNMHPRDSTSSARQGQSLATMHEEDQHVNSVYHEVTGPLSADAGLAFATDLQSASSGWGELGEGNLRASRHRSTSSAAALALHGSGSLALGAAEPHPSLSTVRIGSGSSARSIWERDPPPGEAFGYVGRYRTGSSPHTFHAAVQRGFSFSSSSMQGGSAADVHQSAHPGFLRDRGLSIGSNASASTSSSAAPLHDAFPFSHPGLLAEKVADGATGSYFPSAGFGQSAFYADPVTGQAGGTESRRHSIAGDVTPDTGGAFGGQRRAVGFEVSRTIGFGAPSRSAHRQSTSGRNRSSSFAPFGSGSLALTDDDLAGDSDFVPLQKELDRAKKEQDREQQHHYERHEDDGGFRVPSGTAAASGAHAASMPSGFGQRSAGGFGASPAASVLEFGRQPHSGRLALNSSGGAGMDSLSASWDIMTPSAPSSGRSPDDRRDSIARMTDQLRQTTIGSGRGDVRGPSGPDRANDDGHAAGTDTVKASPGGSPRQPQRFSLSPTAKVFQGSQLGSSTAALTAAENLSALSAYDGAYLRQRSSSIADHTSLGTGTGTGTGTFQQHVNLGGHYHAGVGGPGSGAAAFGPAPAAGFQPSAGAAGGVGGFAGPYMAPGYSLPAPAQLTDFAMSGLASLGPLPPPSGGGSGGGSGFGPGSQQQTDLQDLGKGVPLSSLAKDTPLYIVEFKQGRTDLFFRPRGASDEHIAKGDLVIVEADRGKDLGSVVNDSITVEQVQSFLAHQSELAMIAAGGGGRGGTSDDATSSGGAGGLGSSPSSPTTVRPTRSINPKRLFGKATPADMSLLYSKAQDEERALQLCITKVGQRGLPMTIVAAEMQWDRRKLTFYYTASMRVDFRDLVKELFRLYKTRIWMCHLGHPSGTGMM